MTKQRLPLLRGLEAARANLVPGLIVQAAMLVVVVVYYCLPGARPAFEVLAQAKLQWGYAFSLVAGCLAGGLLPEILNIVAFQRGSITRANIDNFKFALIYWGCDGVVVDAFYRQQAIWFGQETDLSTVTAKVLVDQFIFNPFFAAPIGVACFAWKNQGFARAGMLRVFTTRFYRQQVVPALVATWGVWCPVTAAIYALPSPLQIPLFALALTFWVMLFTYITRAESDRTVPRPQGPPVIAAAE